MTRRVVIKQGQDIFSLAAKHGLRHWRAIWDHPDNADLKTTRKSPGMLHPGDVVIVPNPERKKHDGTDKKKHRFKASGELPMLRLVVLDLEGNKLVDRPYELYVEKKLVATGDTGSAALIEYEIEPAADAGELRVFPDDKLPEFCYKWELKVGWLNDASELRGVQGRLRNLGYPAGPVDGIMGKQTGKGLRLFEIDQGWEPEEDVDDVDDVDDATRERLVERHDQQR